MQSVAVSTRAPHASPQPPLPAPQQPAPAQPQPQPQQQLLPPQQPQQPQQPLQPPPAQPAPQQPGIPTIDQLVQQGKVAMAHLEQLKAYPPSAERLAKEAELQAYLQQLEVVYQQVVRHMQMQQQQQAQQAQQAQQLAQQQQQQAQQQQQQQAQQQQQQQQQAQQQQAQQLLQQQQAQQQLQQSLPPRLQGTQAAAAPVAGVASVPGDVAAAEGEVEKEKDPEALAREAAQRERERLASLPVGRRPAPPENTPLTAQLIWQREVAAQQPALHRPNTARFATRTRMRTDLHALTAAALATYSELLPPESELPARQQLLERLQALVTKVAPEAQLYVFGSSVSGLASRGADLDLTLMTRSGESEIPIDRQR